MRQQLIISKNPIDIHSLPLIIDSLLLSHAALEAQAQTDANVTYITYLKTHISAQVSTLLFS